MADDPVNPTLDPRGGDGDEAPATVGKVKEILTEFLEPFKKLLGDDAPDLDPAEGDDKPMGRREAETWFEEKMAEAITSLEKKAKAPEPKRAPTPPTPKPDVDPVPKEPTGPSGEHQPQLPSGSFRSRFQRAMGWVSDT